MVYFEQIHHNYYMENEKFKKIIIILMVILLIISVIIIFAINYLSNINNIKENDKNVTEEGENFTENYGKIENGGVDELAYNDIMACMKKYLNTINIKSQQYGSYNENEQYTQTTSNNEIKQKIYNLLGSKYISEKGITLENLQEKIKIIQKSSVFVPIEMRLLNDGDIRTFVIHGLIEDAENYNVIDKIFAIINIDFYQNTFSIEPLYENYNNINEIKLERFEENIVNNKDNTFNFTHIKPDEKPEEYIELYKRLALGYPEKVYELLDENYKNTKFGNIDEFKKYIQDNTTKIKQISLEKYQTIIENNKLKYICIDQNDKYYIFYEKEPFQDYSIILDTYVIDLPEFTEKYNVATVQQKTGMNIEKIIAAINDKDYKYIYSKLDNTFRNTQFPTQESLKSYIERNLYNENSIEYVEFSEEGGLCVYKTKITNKNISNSQVKNFNIIMQLGEGTNFTMSFSVE